MEVDPGADVVSRRRGPAEIRSLLLASAQTLFSRHGYTRTSTRSIAEEAGVAEVLLFRHFGGKANLFREAVYQPLVSALEEFLDEWADREVEPAGPDAPATALLATLHTILSGRQGAMIALTGAQTYTEEVRSALDGHQHPMERILDELERILLRYAAAFGYVGLNPPLSARTVVATVLGTTVFRTWLLPSEGPSVTDDEIVGELETLLVHGVLHRPA